MAADSRNGDDQSVEDRAWEFVQAAFASFDLPEVRLREYSGIIAELIQGAIDEDRQRAAGLLEAAGLALKRLRELNRDDENGIRIVLANAIARAEGRV